MTRGSCRGSEQGNATSRLPPFVEPTHPHTHPAHATSTTRTTETSVATSLRGTFLSPLSERAQKGVKANKRTQLQLPSSSSSPGFVDVTLWKGHLCSRCGKKSDQQKAARSPSEPADHRLPGALSFSCVQLAKAILYWTVFSLRLIPIFDAPVRPASAVAAGCAGAPLARVPRFLE